MKIAVQTNRTQLMAEGGPRVVDRVMRGSIVIPNFSVSMTQRHEDRT